MCKETKALNQAMETLSVPEAGRVLGVGRVTAFRLAHKVFIPTLRVGERKLRVPKSALQDLLAKAGDKGLEVD